jgi:hypothetical protein
VPDRRADHEVDFASQQQAASLFIEQECLEPGVYGRPFRAVIQRENNSEKSGWEGDRIVGTPAMGTRFCRLPLAYDPTLLTTDLTACLDRAWTQHVNRRDYSGAWTGLALRSASGIAADLLSVPGVTGYRDTDLLDACPYFRNILESLLCEKETVRLLCVAPAGVVHEHRDRGASYADGFFRLHIPIMTNADTRFVVDGVVLPMQPGECWYANFSLTHSVRNDGHRDRVHLIIDGIRNDWSNRLFADAGYDFDAETRERRFDAETRARIVDELRARGTETDLRLVAALQADA